MPLLLNTAFANGPIVFLVSELIVISTTLINILPYMTVSNKVIYEHCIMDCYCA